MRNINNKKKGATNVKNASMRQKGKRKIFSSRAADVIRDESKWNAFQLIGDTNTEERNHISNRKMSKAEMQRVLDRGLAFRMGRKVRMILEAESA